MTDEQLLTSVQEAVFRYFWDYGHPVSGLAREGYGFGHSPDICTSGGTGMGLMAICVGAERKFVTRAEAAGRVLQILTFLEEKASRYPRRLVALDSRRHTGATKPFSQYDDGGDLVETAYVVQGLLTVRQYFNDAERPRRDGDPPPGHPDVGGGRMELVSSAVAQRRALLALVPQLRLEDQHAHSWLQRVHDRLSPGDCLPDPSGPGDVL